VLDLAYNRELVFGRMIEFESGGARFFFPVSVDGLSVVLLVACVMVDTGIVCMISLARDFSSPMDCWSLLKNEIADRVSPGGEMSSTLVFSSRVVKSISSEITGSSTSCMALVVGWLLQISAVGLIT
jgi:hypothetical protein